MCNCINDTNKALAKLGNNTKLDIPIIFNARDGLNVAKQCSVLTARIDDHKRKPPARLFASYCPFCGEKYAEDSDG